MSMYIHIAGPDGIGSPVVRIGAGGKYDPDIIDDITRRAVGAFRELFEDMFEHAIEPGELIVDAGINDPIEFMPVDPDTEAGQ